MIDSTHFMLAYKGNGNDGYIKTFSIDGLYNITQIDSLEHDTVYGSDNSLAMIDSTHFMLAYAGNGYDGYIKVFSIDGSYNITQKSSLDHDTSARDNSLVMIDSTHFMLAYTGNDYDGYIKTFSIDGLYNITQIDSLEHDTVYGSDNSLAMIDSTHFMLAYAGNGYDGYIKTFAIVTGGNNPPHVPTLSSPPDGAIDQSLTLDLVFNYSDPDSDNCDKFDLQVDNNSTFASPEINETDYSLGGPWSSGGTITYSVSSGLSNETKYYWKVRVYDGTDWSDWSNGTWDFTTAAGPGPGTEKTIIGKGDNAYRIEIDDDLNVTAYINNKSVTAQITKTWYHIVLTYDKDAGGTDEIKLYINGVLKDTADYSNTINTNSDVLKIGDKILGKIDNVSIYNKAISYAQIQQYFAAGVPAHGIAMK